MRVSAQPDQLPMITITQENSLNVPALHASCDAKSGGQGIVLELRLETVPQSPEKLNLGSSLKVKAMFGKANSVRCSPILHHTALQNPTFQPHSRFGACKGGQLQLLS